MIHCMCRIPIRVCSKKDKARPRWNKGGLSFFNSFTHFLWCNLEKHKRNISVTQTVEPNKVAAFACTHQNNTHGSKERLHFTDAFALWIYFQYAQLYLLVLEPVSLLDGRRGIKEFVIVHSRGNVRMLDK